MSLSAQHRWCRGAVGDPSSRPCASRDGSRSRRLVNDDVNPGSPSLLVKRVAERHHYGAELEICCLRNAAIWG